MQTWGYLLVFVLSFLVDLIPLIGPPAWTAMVFCLIVFKLETWPVLFLGVIASTLGRYCMSLYIPRISDRIIKKDKNQDLVFIGKKLEQHGWKARLFIFLYTLTPLSTTALFTAIGVARVSATKALPSFFLGKLISDGFMLEAGNYVAQNPKAVLNQLISPQFFIYTLLGLFLVSCLLFTDWRSLLEHKKLKFRFRIWK
jgi:membrane protein DedA with SNARE-associated domain